MAIFYSAKERAFFDGALRPAYAEAGTWPTDAVEVTPNQHAKFSAEPPEDKRLGSDATGQPVWADLPNEQAISRKAERKRAAVHQEWSRTLQDGMAWTMPDGTEDIVQMRQQDQTNLLGLAMKAQQFLAAGDKDSVMHFRAGSNRTYVLTPEQMAEMTAAALARAEYLYGRMWALKDQIEAARATGDSAALDAVAW